MKLQVLTNKRAPLNNIRYHLICIKYLKTRPHKASRWYQSGIHLLGASLQVLASTLAAHKDSGTLNDQVNALAMDTAQLSI